jgi:ribulose 1,5-bisphosphate synthetase/thiazole synthase
MRCGGGRWPGGGLQAECVGQSKMRAMLREFLKRTKKKPSEVALEQLVLDKPDKFIYLT